MTAFEGKLIGVWIVLRRNEFLFYHCRIWRFTGDSKSRGGDGMDVSRISNRSRLSYIN